MARQATWHCSKSRIDKRLPFWLCAINEKTTISSSGRARFPTPAGIQARGFFGGAPCLAHQDIQQALNAIRGEVERVDDETKWAALELMPGTSSSVVALAKKMVKPETKTVTRKDSNLEISR